ncbi:MAG: cystathionine gamma-synthase [Bernardetiaceae bacterium]|jgi:cystathionine beta-lyase/cystathionine gamma-synthase|nr:cystathionine gamma-synthase [Bernardetiaceae bacterium]
MKFATKAVHAGVHPDPSTGAIMTPIYQTSTYVQASPGQHKGYEYARTQNPTRDALQASLAALENGRFAYAFASGLAAIDTVLKTLNPGDEVIAANDLYGGTYRIFMRVFAKFGLKFHFIDMHSPASIEPYLNANTKLIWLETPTNPLLNIIDIAEVCRLAQARQIRVAVDNTFASPYLQNPLDLGADVVMHSVTKYIAGHSDVVMGALITNHEGWAQEFKFLQNAVGAVPAPQDCFLVLRGIKTLHLRLQATCQNGLAIAQFLANHPKIGRVYYPGLPGHPNHAVAARQMRGFGGMLSFTLKNDSVPNAVKVLESFQLFALAESLGGVESLCGHPATMTHASIPKAEREAYGLVDSLIRLSVGIEDAEDLMADLDQALTKV